MKPPNSGFDEEFADARDARVGTNAQGENFEKARPNDTPFNVRNDTTAPEKELPKLGPPNTLTLPSSPRRIRAHTWVTPKANAIGLPE